MEDIIKIIKSLVKALVYYQKGVSESIQKGGILSILLGMILASLLGNISEGKGMNRAGEGFLRAGYGSSIKSKDL